jgi:hypothetical protein
MFHLHNYDIYEKKVSKSIRQYLKGVRKIWNPTTTPSGVSATAVTRKKKKEKRKKKRKNM